MRYFAIFLITLYQFTLSPILKVVLGTTCRYEETCSNYTKRQIREKGIIKGSLVGMRRLLSCQPFAKIQQ